MFRKRKPVACTYCGFLTQRISVGGGYPEVEVEERQHGTDHPFCIAFAFPIRAEVMQAVKDWSQTQLSNPDQRYTANLSYTELLTRASEVANLDVITRERDCPEFTPYRPGYSPRETQELIDRQRERRGDFRWRILEASLVVATTAAVVIGSVVARG